MTIRSRADAKRLARLSAKARAKKAKVRRETLKVQREAKELARRNLTILEAIETYWPQFTGPTWRAWQVVLKALFALPMNDEDRAIFANHTGGRPVPTEPVTEATMICGRRAGKSAIAGLVATYVALCRDYRDALTAGERGIVAVMAADRRQAQVVFGYIVGLLESSPALAELIQVRRKDSIDLTTGITIEVATADFRLIRGRTVVGAVLDETSFWRSETSSNPDSEVMLALRPSMATIPNALLLSISTPFSRRGEVWKAYETHFGQPSPVFVWKAASRDMNETIPQATVDRALADDPHGGAAEWLAEFRTDLASLFDPEVIQAAIQRGRHELAPLPEVRYVAFCDPSGGRADAYAVCIAHVEDERVIVDALREVRAPFDPDAVTREFAELVKSYRCRAVRGDRFAGEWPRQRWRKCSIEYKVESSPKSDLYLRLLPLMNSGRVELPDHKRLVTQLERLERRTTRLGKETVDHPRHGRDDLANAMAGAVLLAVQKESRGGLIIGPCELLRPPGDELFAGSAFEPYTFGSGE